MRNTLPRPGVVALVAATTAAQAASTMGSAVFPVVAPPLAMEVGVEAATIGYLISLAFGTAAITSPFMSFLVVRWGACRATQFGLGVTAIGAVLAVTATFAGLAACGILVGLGMTLMTPASGHLLFRFSPARNRNLIFSIKQTGVPLGWMLMALIAPAVTLAFGWRAALGLVALVCVATAAAMQPAREHWDDDRDPRARAGAGAAAGLKVLWRYPVLRGLSMAAACLTFVQLCLSTFLVTMLVEDAGYSLIAAGVVLSMVHGAGVAGRILWGWLADRRGDSVVFLQRIAAAIAACCMVTGFVGPAWPLVVLAVFFTTFGLVAVGWNGLFLAEVAHASPRGMVSVATSAALVWNYGGVLLGPALFAVTYGYLRSYTLTFALASIVALGAVLALTFARRARRAAS